jgi:hypothetical protein
MAVGYVFLPVLILFIHVVQASIERSGRKFFDTSTGDQFFVKGVYLYAADAAMNR